MGASDKPPKPRMAKDLNLPAMMFDPGEVTATYPVGALAKQIGDFAEGQKEEPPQDDDDRLNLPTSTKTPLPDARSSTNDARPYSTPGGINPILLFAISLTIGGSLAVLVVMVAAIIVGIVG